MYAVPDAEYSHKGYCEYSQKGVLGVLTQKGTGSTHRELVGHDERVRRTRRARAARAADAVHVVLVVVRHLRLEYSEYPLREYP